MKRENISLATDLDRKIRAIDKFLSKERPFSLTNIEIRDALKNISIEKLRALLEEKKAELEKQIEEL